MTDNQLLLLDFLAFQNLASSDRQNEVKVRRLGKRKFAIVLRNPMLDIEFGLSEAGSPTSLRIFRRLAESVWLAVALSPDGHVIFEHRNYR